MKFRKEVFLFLVFYLQNYVGTMICSYILLILYGTLKPAYVPHVNTQMLCHIQYLQ